MARVLHLLLLAAVCGCSRNGQHPQASHEVSGPTGIVARVDRVERDGTVTARFTSPVGHVVEAKVTFPEVRGAVATNRAEFLAVARRTAAGEPRKLMQFAEIGVNGNLKADARELLRDVLAADCGFDEAFHAMRLAYKCGAPELGERAAELALGKTTDESLKRQVRHFKEKYANRNR